MDGITLSVHRGTVIMSQLILLVMRVVPISWIPDLESHLAACSTLARRQDVGKALYQTRALVKIQNKVSKCYL